MIKKFVEDYSLTKAIDFAIPREIISRIELDLIDTTFVEDARESKAVIHHTDRNIIEEHVKKIVVGYYVDIGEFLFLSDQSSLMRETMPDTNQPPQGYDWTGSQFYDRELFESITYYSLDEALASGDPVFYVTKRPVEWQNYLWTGDESFMLMPIYGYVNIPARVEVTEWDEPVINKYKVYIYETGIKNLVASNHFYTEVLSRQENITFSNGIPFKISMTDDEYLPPGSYINFWFCSKDGRNTPIIPNNREWTTEVLKFSDQGVATLQFTPKGEVYIYRNEESIMLPVVGRAVNGTTANSGALNTLSGTTFWARYQVDKDKANIIPGPGRVATYYSNEGNLGELFPGVPASKSITLSKTPYVDVSRLTDDTYTPVSVVIDGYSVIDNTNWDNKYEEMFPVEPEYDHELRIIHYKVRGNTIFFEEAIDRPVRVFYEHVAQTGTLLIQLGVINSKADCPVLYSYRLSYI